MGFYVTHAAHPSQVRAVHFSGLCSWQQAKVVMTTWSVHIMHLLKSNLVFAMCISRVDKPVCTCYADKPVCTRCADKPPLVCQPSKKKT